MAGKKVFATGAVRCRAASTRRGEMGNQTEAPVLSGGWDESGLGLMQWPSQV
jgi:hypothetical protein